MFKFPPTNTKQLASLHSTIKDIVSRLNVIEQEQAEYMEGEATVEVSRTKTNTNKDKEDKESDVSELKESMDTKSNKDSVKEPKDISYNSREKQKFNCPECNYVCEKRVTFNKHINTIWVKRL